MEDEQSYRLVEMPIIHLPSVVPTFAYALLTCASWCKAAIHGIHSPIPYPCFFSPCFVFV